MDKWYVVGERRKREENQQKIGSFFKELRNEKNLTQEQLAEVFGVSRRTVSRWETGSNMPNLTLLVEMADFYDVDLRELLDGERKSERMDKELEETVFKVADYSNEEKRRLTRVLHWLFVVGVISFMCFFVLLFTRQKEPTFLYGVLEGITLSIPFAMVSVGALFTGKHAGNLKEDKLMLLWEISLVVLVVAGGCLVGSKIAGVQLSDACIRVCGISELIILPINVFATVKIYFTKQAKKEAK